MSELFHIFMKGKNCFEKGIATYNGYCFLFVDPNPLEFTSSKISSAGAFYGIEKRFLHSNVKDVDHLSDLLNYDIKIDLLFAGSLKTLVPTLQFGLGFETLFNVLVIVKTPDNKILPITYYYGPSGTAIGGLHSPEDIIKKVFKTGDLFVLDPFKLPKLKVKELLIALEGSLRKVPMTDFEGLYEHDCGKSLMGLEGGKPFISDNYITELDLKIKTKKLLNGFRQLKEYK